MKMIRAMMASIVALVASSAFADHPLPEVMNETMAVIAQTPCMDEETKEDGFCVMLQAVSDGTIYILFIQDDVIIFIRKITKDGYEEIYSHPNFSAI